MTHNAHAYRRKRRVQRFDGGVCLVCYSLIPLWICRHQKFILPSHKSISHRIRNFMAALKKLYNVYHQRIVLTVHVSLDEFFLLALALLFCQNSFYFLSFFVVITIDAWISVTLVVCWSLTSFGHIRTRANGTLILASTYLPRETQNTNRERDDGVDCGTTRRKTIN